jgi:two-component system, cell cycle sensor histidine kinase and response regulator CckA
VASECARICADPAQLQQVLLNLGVNARDAMPRGGVLIMRTGETSVTEPLANEAGTLQPGIYVTLTVQDTGCGMDADTKARIFEPFFTTKSLGKGTGLGLATVYGVVNQSGGAVFVESTIGKGTTFTIYLPRAEGPVAPPRAQAPRLETSQHRETILVIEDEEMVRELVCTVLSEQGYTILCTGNGHEGLRMAREHEGPIDLLVSDVIMPQITGPEIARELLAARPKTKVLYISGYSDADISEDGVLSPSVQLLGKPFAPDALSRRVREVLDDGIAADP